MDESKKVREGIYRMLDRDDGFFGALVQDAYIRIDSIGDDIKDRTKDRKLAVVTLGN